jgi:hypothetical protein
MLDPDPESDQINADPQPCTVPVLYRPKLTLVPCFQIRDRLADREGLLRAGGEGLRRGGTEPGRHQDHQEQETFPPSSSDRIQTVRHVATASSQV